MEGYLWMNPAAKSKWTTDLDMQVGPVGVDDEREPLVDLLQLRPQGRDAADDAQRGGAQIQPNSL